jgi:phosphoribosyl 1,2-cyclic phosphodiesterase
LLEIYTYLIILRMSLKVKFWGVRGSLPHSLPPHLWVKEFKKNLKAFFAAGYRKSREIDEFIDNQKVSTLGGYGTATTCVEVKTESSQLIIDCGSGIKRLADSMLAGPAGKGKAKIHIYMTHFHWDHVIGLPFFVPIFIPGNEIHFYSIEPDLENLIRKLFLKPYFPVEFDSLPSKIYFHVILPREAVQIDDITMTPYQLDHPDPCWGLKVVSGGRTYSHCVDSEGTRASQKSLGLDLPLYQNVDVLYFDAQYTLRDLADKLNWGHSAAQIGLDISFRENVKRIIFTHHDPGATTDHMLRLEEQTLEYYEWRVEQAKKLGENIPEVKWSFVYDEQEIEV